MSVTIRYTDLSGAETPAVAFFHVIIKTYFTLVALVTVGAELLPALVVRQPMRLHVVHETEGLATNIARVRFFARMNNLCISNTVE